MENTHRGWIVQPPGSVVEGNSALLVVESSFVIAVFALFLGRIVDDDAAAESIASASASTSPSGASETAVAYMRLHNDPMECWNAGILECWETTSSDQEEEARKRKLPFSTRQHISLSLTHRPIIPLFHYSVILWDDSDAAA